MPRKKIRTENLIPIQMLDRIKRKANYAQMFHDFDECEKIVSRDFPDIKFDSRCYIPSYFIMELLKAYGGKAASRNDVATVFQLAAWRRYKQIYSFDADFVDVLIDSATDELIPCEALKAVPYPSFYIEINGDSQIGKGITGFFTAFDIIGDDVILNLLVTYSDGAITAVPIILKDGMSIQDSFKEIKRLIIGIDPDRVSDKNIMVMNNIAVKAIQLVLYICAVNADINENQEQKSYKRKPASYKMEKDIARECEKWDVGYRIGNVIRMQNNTETAEREYKPNHRHTPKRPHMRRGHFHHYWKGSRILGNREIVLKWIPPTFINANLDELPAVIQEVR